MNRLNNWRVFLVSIVAIVMSGMAVESWSGQGWGGGRQGGSNPALSAAEVADLLYMREEEKLARDVYRTLYGCTGNQVFLNISGSEQQHMDSLAAKIMAYGLEDPVIDDTTGIFQNLELYNYYNRLIASCSSLSDAFYAGGWVEEVDIFDLREAIEHSSHGDLIQVYENLMRGSRNHLRAFVGRYESLGLTYVAQKLPQEEVDAIVDQPVERGGRR